MTRFISWLIVLVLFGGFGAAAYVAIRARAAAGKDMPPYSVYSAERDGLADAAELLHQLGWEPVAVTRPVSHARIRGLLILAEPKPSALLPGQEPDLPEPEVRGLLRWV